MTTSELNALPISPLRKKMILNSYYELFMEESKNFFYFDPETARSITDIGCENIRSMIAELQNKFPNLTFILDED